jgi:hypothetical protein
MALYTVAGQVRQITYGAAAKTRGVTRYLIVNRDETNQIYIGSAEVGTTPPDLATPDKLQASIVDPLGNVTVTGDRNWFAYSPSGQPVVVDVVENGGEWAPSPAQVAVQLSALGLMLDTTGHLINTTLGTPAQTPDIQALHSGSPIASEIAAAGTGLLTSAGLLISDTRHVIGAGQTITYAPVPVSRIGYDGLIQCLNAGGGTNPFATVTMRWADSSAGVDTAQEIWYPASGTSGPEYFLGGPTKGDQLIVMVTNNDTVSLQFSIFVSQNSRVYARDDWRSPSWSAPGIPGFTLPNSDPTSLILAITNPTVNAGQTVNRLLPLYAGYAQLYYNPPSGSSSQVKILPTGNQGPVDNTTPLFVAYSTGGTINAQVMLPRCNCELQISNIGSGSMSPSASLTATEQPA